MYCIYPAWEHSKKVYYFREDDKAPRKLTEQQSELLEASVNLDSRSAASAKHCALMELLTEDAN